MGIVKKIAAIFFTTCRFWKGEGIIFWITGSSLVAGLDIDADPGHQFMKKIQFRP